MMIDQTHLFCVSTCRWRRDWVWRWIRNKKTYEISILGLGLVMLVLGFLEYKHWISVNWTVTENQSSAVLTHLANKIATVTQHMNHEIPIGVGVLGFMPGLVLGLYKG